MILNSGITWNSRGGNRFAHEIAFLASKGRLNSNWTTHPPDALRSVITGDCMQLSV